jgi:hypothetical protein
MLTGGLGNDILYWKPSAGKDRIADFDANGGGHKQDYISTAAGVRRYRTPQGGMMS